ncbi:MAG TPA: hypothetical protein VJA66_03275 [Thermoanaerobaculia bacterium]
MAESFVPPEGRTAAVAKKKPVRRRKPAAARKPGAASRARRPRSTTNRARSQKLDRLIRQLVAQAGRAKTRIASISEEGAVTARRSLGKASAASKKTFERIAREWRGMDAKKRIQLVTALIGAVAAASAPIVRKKLKKR